MTMYTEVTHRELEVLVRVQGSLFLLGPLWADEVGGFFRLVSRQGKDGLARANAPAAWVAAAALARRGRRVSHAGPSRPQRPALAHPGNSLIMCWQL